EKPHRDGIGRELCNQLIKSGAKVISVGKTTLMPNDSRLYNFKKDLSDLETWKQLAASTINLYNRIDILVNCVGILKPGTFEKLNKSDIDNYIRNNLLSIIYGAKTVLPFMKKQGNGHIINVGSLGGIIPMPFETLYSTTKFAVRGFTLSLAEELRNAPVKVSLISPGSVLTRMLDIEAADDNSFISFVSKILSPQNVVKEIIKTIHRPKREVLVPRISGIIAVLFNLFQNLFFYVFPILRLIGQRNQHLFRKKYLVADN
ncbi:SDR family NAD(P)-dependent oxidoreductase, partial [Bacteroidota bacterium]